MATLPDFTDAALFPGFGDLPESTSADVRTQPWFLVGTIKDDMTIMKPTLVLRDMRTESPFALVFEGLGRDDLDLKKLGFKKGATAVVPSALRTPPADETKRGFVKVEKGDAGLVKAIPAPAARVVELGMRLRERKEDKCEMCSKEDGALLKCTGCGGVKYCSKVSDHPGTISREATKLASI